MGRNDAGNGQRLALLLLSLLSLQSIPQSVAFTTTTTTRTSSYPITAITIGPYTAIQTRTHLSSTATTETTETAAFAKAADETSSSPSISLPRPGWDEDEKFECDESVAFWKSFRLPPTVEESNKILQSIIVPYLTGSSNSNKSDLARAYWIYHATRSGYFATNAVVGVLAHVVHERVIKQSDKVARFGLSKFDNISDLANTLAKLLVEAFYSYEQNWKWVDQGVLTYPWDAAFQPESSSSSDNRIRFALDHRQANPLFALQETSRLVQESIGVWGRRLTMEGKSNGAWLNQPVSKAAADAATSSQPKFSRAPKFLSGPAANRVITPYPSYFLNDFHYQTDGWLSSESAARYEVGTETLFLGRQDSMQRQTIVPVKKHFAATAASAPTSILEVACGTGRFATFVRDNFPTSQLTLVDLSPFYLEKARENEKYWRKYRGKQAMKLANNKNVGGGNEVEAPDNTVFVQANAERLPFEDNSFDAVMTVYLFHELPPEARANAAAEMARVVKPGGIVSFSDSLQRGDRPSLDQETNLEEFSKLNEPFYVTYLAEDIPALFQKHGMKCREKYMNSRTKTLSFIKEG